MTWRRSYPHQNLKARQDPNTSLVPGFQPTTATQNTSPPASNTPTLGNSGDNGNGHGKGGDSHTTTAATTPIPSPSPVVQTPTPNPVTGPNSPTTTSPTSTPVSSPPVSSTTTSTPTTTTTPNNGHGSPTTTGLVSTPKVVGPSTATYTFTSTSGITAPTGVTTGSDSGNNSNSVGGMSAGALVGAIAGGLFGLICLIAIGSYILRWWNKRSAERDFVDDYNPSDNMGNSSAHDFPPPMIQHSSSPSFASGAGVAGQGVFASRATAAGPGAYRGGYGGYPNVDDESINGPYSSQPQPQAPFNPEPYGQYAPYPPDADYQEAMRGYQAQRGYEAPVDIGYAMSEPPAPQHAVPASLTPRSTSPKTTAAAAIAAAHAAAATHGPPASASGEQRQSAVYNEEDAYGGF